MKRIYILMLLSMAACVFPCMAAAFSGEAGMVILSVECRNVRKNGSAAKLNPSFEDTHTKWLIRCPGASATKVSESPTGVQWRIQPMGREYGRVIVEYRDKFGQQHHAAMQSDPANSSMELTMRRRVNRLQIGKTNSRVTSVFFAKAGKKDDLTDEDTCLPAGNGAYDFPAIWQGPQKAWSLYFKTASGVREIPAEGNFFGIWGDFVYAEQGGNVSFTAKSGFQRLNSK